VLRENPWRGRKQRAEEDKNLKKMGVFECVFHGESIIFGVLAAASQRLD
jgi:hypothetical protein